jgi:hypothetical protein
VGPAGGVWAIITVTKPRKISHAKDTFMKCAPLILLAPV